MESDSVHGTSRESRGNSEGWRCSAPVPCRTGEIPYHGRIQEETARVFKNNWKDISDISYQQQSIVGSRGKSDALVASLGMYL